MTTDDDTPTTVGDTLDNLSGRERQRATGTITGARREMRNTVERLRERLEAANDPDSMTLAELEELAGELRDVAGNLNTTADRLAIAWDDLQASEDTDG